VIRPTLWAALMTTARSTDRLASALKTAAVAAVDVTPIAGLAQLEGPPTTTTLKLKQRLQKHPALDSRRGERQAHPARYLPRRLMLVGVRSCRSKINEAGLPHHSLFGVASEFCKKCLVRIWARRPERTTCSRSRGS
jgi:hypothetical protein